MSVTHIRPQGSLSPLTAAAAMNAASRTAPKAASAIVKQFGQDALTLTHVKGAAILPALTLFPAHMRSPEATNFFHPNPVAATLQLEGEFRRIGIAFKPKVVVDWTSFVGDPPTLIHLNRFKFSPAMRTLTQRSMSETSFMHLLRHESAHAFENIALKPAMMGEYKAAFGSANRAYNVSFIDQVLAGVRYKNGPDFVSKYAQVHPVEDFAETMAVYTRLAGKNPAIRRYVAQKGGSELLEGKFAFVGKLARNFAKLHPAL
ncbi:MAG: putative zinc-binding metallopeptidase [Candidatus Sericytochromatia bacterium]|nr:putative zinc-binding metallopeptidase [Candidatus Sericytochromatia bacterium]